VPKYPQSAYVIEMMAQEDGTCSALRLLKPEECSHNPNIRCGFVCTRYRSSQTPLKVDPADLKILQGRGHQSLEQEIKPSTVFPYKIGVYPGTFRTFIDLESEDAELERQKSTPVSGIDESYTSKLAAFESDSILPDTQVPSCSKQVALQQSSDNHLGTSLDDQLPDTQFGSLTVESQDEMTPLHLGISTIPYAYDIPHVTESSPVDDEDYTHHVSLLRSFPDLDILLPDTQVTSLSARSVNATLPAYLISSQISAASEFSSHVCISTDTDQGYRYHEAKRKSSSDFDDFLPDTQIGSVESNVNLSWIDQSEPSSPSTQVSSDSIQKSSFTNVAFEVPESIVGTNPSTQDTPRVPRNKLTCRERKRITVSSNRPAKLTESMKLWISKTHYLLDPFREDDECWLHPSPPPAQVAANGTIRPCGKLQKTFTWQDCQGKHSIILNYGIVSKLVFHKMTKQQKDGFITKQWHLSHLCGNWTCLNPAHTTVEPGAVNISRNNCFSHRCGCPHSPKCMKERKIALGTDGKPVDHNRQDEILSAAAVDGWDDWTPIYGDDNEFVGTKVEEDRSPEAGDFDDFDD
jgi:hypothetical protein